MPEGLFKAISGPLRKFSKTDFLKGAKVAYESIITNFSKGDLKSIKTLLDKNVYDQFDDAIKDKKTKNLMNNNIFNSANEIVFYTACTDCYTKIKIRTRSRTCHMWPL